MSETTINEGPATEEIYCMGFRFTAAEQAAMRRAEINARRFMILYGAGRKPFMVDKSHYIQCLPPNLSATPE